MAFTSIIAEFNPLHNGHKYLIEKAKEYSNNDILILQSGNFVQRGEPSILDKEDRAVGTILEGADLVLELPVFFSMSNAENFAKGAISILNKIHNVEYLVFGSECGDLDILYKLVDILLNETEEYKTELKREINNGILYAKARENAIRKIYGDNLANELSKPNNILGIEYIKALKLSNSKIKPVTFKRVQEEDFISSSSIREMIENNELEQVKQYIPNSTYNLLNNKINLNDAFEKIFTILKYKAIDSSFENISELTEGIDNRILKGLNISSNYNELLSFVKSKRYTMAKIKRIILSYILGITNSIIDSALTELDYVKVLAIDVDKKELLGSETDIKFAVKNSDVPNNAFSQVSQKADALYEIIKNK